MLWEVSKLKQLAKHCFLTTGSYPALWLKDAWNPGVVLPRGVSSTYFDILLLDSKRHATHGLLCTAHKLLRLILLVLEQKSQWMPSLRSPLIHAGVSSLEKWDEKSQLLGRCCFCLGTWGGRRNAPWAGEVMQRARWFSVTGYKRTQLVNGVILATDIFPVCGHTFHARKIAYVSSPFLHKSEVRTHSRYLR
jgi:hypothetical protein